MRVHVLTNYDIFWPLKALTSKRRCFILAHNIRPKFGRTFGTRSVSLPKPSASAECHNLTFGPSLIYITSLPLFLWVHKTSVMFFVVVLSDRYATWCRGEVRPCKNVLHLDPDPHYTFSADFPLRFVIFSCAQ